MAHTIKVDTTIAKARLEPKEAAQMCGQVAASLIQAMSKSTNPGVAIGPENAALRGERSSRW